MSITPVLYGKSVLPESMVFKGGAKEKNLPIVFLVYLIKTKDKMILVDAGCETMPGFVMEDFIGPVKALEKINVSADEITDLVITHAHHDHIASANRFKNAVVYIQEEEYKSGKKYLTESKEIVTFDDEYTICENVKAIKIGGHSKGSSIVEVTNGDKIYVIAGDECYLKDCIDKQIPTGASCCEEKSLAFIQKYKKDCYVPLICHDPMVATGKPLY